MYGISKTKMINPMHVVSIEYKVNDIIEGTGQTGSVFIQMVNQPDGKAYEIAGPCAQCEDIIRHLMEVIKGINREEEVKTKDFTILPGGNIDFSGN